MTDGPSKDNLLLKTAVSILSGVLLVVFGYWINGYLSRDNLSIEYVRFVPLTQAQGPLAEIHRKMRRLSSNTLGQPFNPAPCTPVNPMYGATRTILTVADIRLLQTCLESSAEDAKSDTESLGEVLSKLDKNPAPADLDGIISKWPSFFSPAMLDQGIKVTHEQKLQTAKHEVKQATTDSTDTERTVADLLELLKQVKITRVGALTVVTTIRNSGDTDGLVMDVPENYVILNKNSAKLPIRLVGQYNPFAPYATLNLQRSSPSTVYAFNVPKRSAVTISFLLDPSVLPEPPRIAVTELLKQSQYIDLKGRVILKDTRNRDVESKEFDFPPGPDE